MSAQPRPAIAISHSPLSHQPGAIHFLDPKCLQPNPLSLAIYGEPGIDVDDLLETIHNLGILVPLVVVPGKIAGKWTILSGHRRWACAQSLGLVSIPCQVYLDLTEDMHIEIIISYNNQRQKSFSQLMREADALEKQLQEDAKSRKLANLRQPRSRTPSFLRSQKFVERRKSDAPVNLPELKCNQEDQARLTGRTDVAIAKRLGLGGKDLYRQARAIWHRACQHDVRAQASVAQIDAGTKTIHAAYKDLRRRTQFTTDFKPTPYDVWAFRHNSAFGIPHPGSTPPAIIAHALYYFSPPNGLIVDPMAGGGTVIDVCESMGRRCLAYDLEPTRPDIRQHDVCQGLPIETKDCDLIFCDPPYHTMLAHSYSTGGIASVPLSQWIAFLHKFTRHAFMMIRPGGYLTLLLAPQTEKDLPTGYGYLDHTLLGYLAATRAGFLPERRISCPMSTSYLPQQIRQAELKDVYLDRLETYSFSASHQYQQTDSARVSHS